MMGEKRKCTLSCCSSSSNDPSEPSHLQIPPGSSYTYTLAGVIFLSVLETLVNTEVGMSVHPRPSSDFANVPKVPEPGVHGL
jgi:hypothetical protein